MEKNKENASTKRKYWYFTVIYECVLCGRREEYRERRYTEKPKDYNERNSYHQYACGIHFC